MGKKTPSKAKSFKNKVKTGFFGAMLSFPVQKRNWGAYNQVGANTEDPGGLIGICKGILGQKKGQKWIFSLVNEKRFALFKGYILYKSLLIL